MSASTERKNRIAAREAGTDKKTIAAREEAEKKAKSRRRWTWGTIGVVILIAAILILNSGLMMTATTALTVDGEKYTPARVNYYYGNDYLTLVNQYGNYASMLGLDTSLGLSGLGDQSSPMLENGTWRDYFREAAKNDITQIKAMLNYAAEEGITLSEEELAEIDESFAEMEETAKAYGYRNADALYAINYGTGVNSKIAKQAATDSALATKAYQAKLDSYSWTAEELEEHYASFDGNRDYFNFEIYYVTAKTQEETVTDEEGNETTETYADDASRAEAKATADAIVMAYEDGDDIEEISERFAAAVEAETGARPSARSRYAGSSLDAAYADWLKDEAREAGDIAVFADAEEEPSGYTVVLFEERDDNHYASRNVRHILIQAEASEDGSWSDEALAAAEAKAEEILAEYEAGEKTEESFAALAEEYSEDSGSNTNGGLYENIVRGQMVPEFEAFCFGDHEVGDTAIVYGTNGSYAGYHVMYYAGEGEIYSESLAKSDLQTEAMNAWTEELYASVTAEEGFGFRFVGK